MRAILPALAIAGLCGCTHILPAPDKACPGVRRAEAWVNRMPGPQASGQTLVVVVELESAERWRLEKAALERDPSILTLELSQGGAGHPGSAGYRSPDAGKPRQIDILCNAEPHHTISDVMSVS